MNVRLLLVLVVGSLLTIPTSGFGEEKGKPDAEQIQGVWLPVSGEREGVKAPEGQFDALTITFGADGKGLSKKGGEEHEFRYSLDPTKKLKEIDIIAKERGEEMVLKGIYKLDGDTLTVCVVKPTEDRPTDFVTQPGSTRMLIVFKRQK
jgi:RNA polymerase sigma-70 factor (ECF subfamily)